MKNGRMQAKDLSEESILRILQARPGVWHTHWPRPDSDPDFVLEALSSPPEAFSLPMPWVYDPTRPDAPEKVLRAKLATMLRRGIIEGCDCGCRGDWYVD